MFCHNCGADLPEGTPFCGSCGAAQNTQQQPTYQQPDYQQPVYQQPDYQQPVYQQPDYQQPTYQQPVYQQPAGQPRAVSAPVSRKEYLANHADSATKKRAFTVTVTFLLSLLLLAASVIAPLATPFYEIPALSLALGIADADPDELIDDMEDSLKEIKADLKEQKKYMGKDEREAAEVTVEAMEALTENFSVLNFKQLASVMENEAGDYLDSDDLDDIEQIGQIINIIIIVLVSAFLLPLLFTLLGGLLKSTGLTVTAVVFTVLSQLVLCGILFVALSLVIYIFQAVQCSRIKKAYTYFLLSLA